MDTSVASSCPGQGVFMCDGRRYIMWEGREGGSEKLKE